MWSGLRLSAATIVYGDFFKIFLMWTSFKVKICYNIVCDFFGHEAYRDPSSLTKGWNLHPCIGRQNFNHWTTRKPVLYPSLDKIYIPQLSLVTLKTFCLH